MQFICYKKCGTCQKAKKYLLQNGLAFDYREITEEPMSLEEVTWIYKKSGFPIKKLLNTSGGVYRDLNMKEQAKIMKDEEILQLLSENPMLIKRPILINGNEVLIGFKEQEWETLLK